MVNSSIVSVFAILMYMLGLERPCTSGNQSMLTRYSKVSVFAILLMYMLGLKDLVLVGTQSMLTRLLQTKCKNRHCNPFHAVDNTSEWNVWNSSTFSSTL